MRIQRPAAARRWSKTSITAEKRLWALFAGVRGNLAKELVQERREGARQQQGAAVEVRRREIGS
jgi:hypothetical protein